MEASEASEASLSEVDSEDVLVSALQRNDSDSSTAELVWILAGLWSAVFLGALDG